MSNNGRLLRVTVVVVVVVVMIVMNPDAVRVTKHATAHDRYTNDKNKENFKPTLVSV